MTNEFKIEGKIIEIKNDRTIMLKVSQTTVIPILCGSKLKIEKYNKGEIIEMSGNIKNYMPFHLPQLVANKIIER